MIEAGIPPVQDLIASRRMKFLKIKQDAVDINEPFHFVYDLCRIANTPAFRFLERSALWESPNDPLIRIKQLIRTNAPGASKLTTYTSIMNPTMTIHPIYSCSTFIPDYKRESLSRLRLMSHNLRIETGRWSRTPRDQRVCQCDSNVVQSEQHVLIECPLTQHCRNRYQMLIFTNVTDLMKENDNLLELCSFVYEVLSTYTNH